MTKTTTHTTMHSAGIWIDHRKAQIVGLTADTETSQFISSSVERHPERGGDSPLKGSYEAHQVPADDKQQNALTNDFNAYYDAVITAAGDYKDLLIFGPGEAKGELNARLVKQHQGDRVVAIQTEGKMTERQVVAKVRAYFGVSPTSL